MTVEIRTRAQNETIEARARAAGLPLSEFVRVSARAVTIRARADLDAVDRLAVIAGDLGRLGGLLKPWLADRRGTGAPAVEVEHGLERTDHTMPAESARGERTPMAAHMGHVPFIYWRKVI